MSYRFVKVFTRYPSYLDALYRTHPGLKNMPYDEQFDFIVGDAVGCADFYSRNLRKLGVDANELIANAVELQNIWAREHGLNKTGKELIIEQLKHLRPNVVYFQDCFVHNGAFIDEVRNSVPSIRKVFAWCGAPYSQHHLKNFKAFDVMITSVPTFRRAFQKNGISSYRMQHAFEPSLLPKIERNNPFPNTDIIFCGSMIGTEGFHRQRRRLIRELLKKELDLKVYADMGYEKMFIRISKYTLQALSKFLRNMGLTNFMAHVPILQKAQRWNSVQIRDPFYAELKKFLSKPLFGLNMYRAISKAKIGLNSHIDGTGEYAVNVRMFEVTGVGACLLTDKKKNIDAIFEPGKECVTYRSMEDCVEKIEWLLRNPGEREKIASAGQKKTHQYHTYEKRTEELDEIIKQELARD